MTMMMSGKTKKSKKKDMLRSVCRIRAVSPEEGKP